MKIIGLLYLIFQCHNLFSAPPIEGGKLVPKNNQEYQDIVELKLEYSGECSGTMVKENLILTAAHCVVEKKEKELIFKINSGDTLPGLGKIEKITIHPSYQEAVMDFYYNPKIKRDLAEEKKALYDVAFIELKNKKKRSTPYPQIINADTKFKERNQVELAGFGAKNLYWDKEGWNFDFDEKAKLRSGNNEWITCPTDYFSNDLKKIQELSENVFSSLQLQSISTHIISEGKEVIQTPNKAMIMSGDSGSPAIERDINGKMVITGIASTIKPIEEEMMAPTFEISSHGGLLFTEELKINPKDWGAKEKSDLDFKEIHDILKEKSLLDSEGKIKSGIKVSRKYTRIVTGNFSDLSHPHNQDFIKGVLNKTP